MSVDTESRNVQNHELASGKKTADSTVFSKYINQALDLKALE